MIGGITVIEFEDFREAKNTGNGQEIMVSYIGDDDDIIATYQDLAKEYYNGEVIYGCDESTIRNKSLSAFRW